MNGLRERAPLTPMERVELRRNAADVMRTAIWKGFACDSQHAVLAGKLAQEYFDLGCWLYYYSKRLHLADNLEERVACASRLFEAGFSDPADHFLLVFGFGKQHFAALFRDGGRVLDELARETRTAAAEQTP